MSETRGECKNYFLSLNLYSMCQYLSFEPSCAFMGAFLWKLAIWHIFLVTRDRNTCFTSEFALRTGCIRKGIFFTPHSNIQNLGGGYWKHFYGTSKFDFFVQKHVSETRGDSETDFSSPDLYSMRQYLSFEPSCTFLRPFLWKLVIWPIFLLTRARNTCFR